MKVGKARATRIALALSVVALGVTVGPDRSVTGSFTEGLSRPMPVAAPTYTACAPNAAPARLPADLELAPALTWSAPVAEPGLWHDTSWAGGAPLGFCALRVSGAYNPEVSQDAVSTFLLDVLTARGWDLTPVPAPNGGLAFQAHRSNELLSVTLNGRDTPALSTAGPAGKVGVEAKLLYAVNPFVLPVPQPGAPLRLGIVRAVPVEWGNSVSPGVGAYSQAAADAIDADALRAVIVADLVAYNWSEVPAPGPGKNAQRWQIAAESASGRLLITLVGGVFTPVGVVAQPSVVSIGYELIPPGN